MNTLARFDRGRRSGVEIRQGNVRSRRLELAIPAETTADQMLHVQRAIDYARSVGVDLVVTRVN